MFIIRFLFLTCGVPASMFMTFWVTFRGVFGLILHDIRRSKPTPFSDPEKVETKIKNAQEVGDDGAGGTMTDDGGRWRSRGEKVGASPGGR